MKKLRASKNDPSKCRDIREGNRIFATEVEQTLAHRRSARLQGSIPPRNESITTACVTLSASSTSNRDTSSISNRDNSSNSCIRTSHESQITPAPISKHNMGESSGFFFNFDVGTIIRPPDPVVTSGCTYISGLTHPLSNSNTTLSRQTCEADTNRDAHSKAAPQGGKIYKRRSKRLSCARDEIVKRQRSHLFGAVAPQMTVDHRKREFNDVLTKSTLRREIERLQAINNGGDRYIDIDVISSHIVSQNLSSPDSLLSTLRTPSHESHILNHLYKAQNGKEYFKSLIQRELSFYSASRHRQQSLIIGRPRTRSFCREQDLSPSVNSSNHHTEPLYLKTRFQRNITTDMRATLVNWLIGVAEEFSLAQETMHGSIKIMDRALESIAVTTDTFHVMGCACLLISSKLNEVKRPRTVDIAFLTDSACTPREICDMEKKICVCLEFRLTFSTAFNFIDRFIDASHVAGISFYDNDNDDASITLDPSSCIKKMPPYNPKLEAMTLFIVDSALLIADLVDTKDSLIAAASLYLARAIIGARNDEGIIWSKHLAHHTGYSVHAFADTVILLHLNVRDAKNNPVMSALYKKYNTARYFNVACRTAILTQDLKVPLGQNE
uniref:Cyclin N-terminal domain-containing protein n=1 Tax=Chaetoceros debilis TaxID=122233 RepID=A0A7S3V6R6_9STRA|mmetsp:Transcript_21412/g.31489  ORF Transcript_21412/g.31489 Transcript_21412/m.31489 type:complete len:611 (+) Transcript_21412:231-2063(+)|eukprot:CAMPEP_0194086420 /NCGR_PEP_ID=MMETSP0149-20130528/21078_1 /TAXON_ID=122233 /ORGANISM="Chaetoceros debilis, Strain MM31A-1" /LENGTH=610 /DNA_ID=CAMNT_0038769505 /DNA_START=132 /DNA_END=1964 /DNA_ORIENTATION=+